MVVNEAIILVRDCEAIQIPSGVKLTLSAGTQVRITQALGGTYTVMTDTGLLVQHRGQRRRRYRPGDRTVTNRQHGRHGVRSP